VRIKSGLLHVKVFNYIWGGVKKENEFDLNIKKLIYFKNMQKSSI